MTSLVILPVSQGNFILIFEYTATATRFCKFCCELLVSPANTEAQNEFLWHLLNEMTLYISVCYFSFQPWRESWCFGDPSMNWWTREFIHVSTSMYLYVPPFPNRVQWNENNEFLSYRYERMARQKWRDQLQGANWTLNANVFVLLNANKEHLRFSKWKK